VRAGAGAYANALKIGTRCAHCACAARRALLTRRRPVDNWRSLDYADWAGSDVEAVHFRTYHTVIQTQAEYIYAYESALRTCDQIMENNPGIDCFPYTVFYIYFEQYLNIIGVMVLVLSLAGRTWTPGHRFVVAGMLRQSLTPLQPLWPSRPRVAQWPCSS